MITLTDGVVTAIFVDYFNTGLRHWRTGLFGSLTLLPLQAKVLFLVNLSDVLFTDRSTQPSMCVQVLSHLDGISHISPRCFLSLTFVASSFRTDYCNGRSSVIQTMANQDSVPTLTDLSYW